MSAAILVLLGLSDICLLCSHIVKEQASHDHS